MVYSIFRYHEWMKSEVLQKLTASEPLTLYEEYKMQVSWLDDANSKFISICIEINIIYTIL